MKVINFFTRFKKIISQKTSVEHDHSFTQMSNKEKKIAPERVKIPSHGDIKIEESKGKS